MGKIQNQKHQQIYLNLMEKCVRLNSSYSRKNHCWKNDVVEMNMTILRETFSTVIQVYKGIANICKIT